MDRKSLYERPDGSISDFKYTLSEGSFCFPIQEDSFSTIKDLETRGKGEVLCIEHFLDFIRKRR